MIRTVRICLTSNRTKIILFARSENAIEIDLGFTNNIGTLSAEPKFVCFFIAVSCDWKSYNSYVRAFIGGVSQISSVLMYNIQEELISAKKAMDLPFRVPLHFFSVWMTMKFPANLCIIPSGHITTNMLAFFTFGAEVVSLVIAFRHKSRMEEETTLHTYTVICLFFHAGWSQVFCWYHARRPKIILFYGLQYAVK